MSLIFAPDPAAGYIGLMSGTSLDGVDAALCSFKDGFHLLGHVYLPMPDNLRGQLLALQQPGYDEIHRAALVTHELTTLYAQAVKTLRETVGRRPQVTAIAAIGCHGQTIRHQPEGATAYTLQLNNPALLAELTGLAVGADFRNRDLAAGGEGAPLTPAFHAYLFRQPGVRRLILNLGGMANLSVLPPSEDEESVLGFDCGPGGVLLDAWAARHTGRAFDVDGRWGASGKCDAALLEALLHHPFLQRTPPKSCGREDFNLTWLEDLLARQPHAGELHARPQDVQSTLLALSANSVARAVRQFVPDPEMCELYACGGGTKNPALMQALRDLLPKVDTTASLGLAVDAVESAAFAWLAHRLVHGETGNLPEVTGARGARVLGALYPP